MVWVNRLQWGRRCWVDWFHCTLSMNEQRSWTWSKLWWTTWTARLRMPFRQLSTTTNKLADGWRFVFKEESTTTMLPGKLMVFGTWHCELNTAAFYMLCVCVIYCWVYFVFYISACLPWCWLLLKRQLLFNSCGLIMSMLNSSFYLLYVMFLQL